LIKEVTYGAPSDLFCLEGPSITGPTAKGGKQNNPHYVHS